MKTLSGRLFDREGFIAKQEKKHDAFKKLKKLTDYIGINEMSCGRNQVTDHEWSCVLSSVVCILS